MSNANAILRGLSYVLLTLLTLFSLGAWILAAVDVRRTIFIFGGYNVIDPAFLVAGILGFFFFLTLLAGGASRSINATVATVGTLIFFFWYLGCAIAYSVRAWEFPYNCPRNFRGGREVCYARYLTLMAFSWTLVGLSLLYLFHVIALAVRHPRTSGTESTNGWDGVGIHRLGKSDPRVTEPRMERTKERV